MTKSISINLAAFLIIFLIISAAADLYYYDKVVQKNENGQISYSDFRVYWFASYNLTHHIIRFWDTIKGYPVFRPLWFLDPDWRYKVRDAPRPGQYIIYDKELLKHKSNEESYPFRYSPFVAFIMIPMSKIRPPGNALLVWYALLNAAFLSALFLMVRQLNSDFRITNRHLYLTLWGIFLMSLRFYLTNISLGQTDILISFFFVLFLISYLKNREMICGILLALILQFKLFFAPILVYLLITKRMKIVLSTVISFISFMFIPAYMFGIEKIMMLLRDWLEIVNGSVASEIVNYKNQSLIRIIGKPFPHLAYFVSAALTLTAYAGMAWLRRFGELKEKKFKYLEISMFIIISLLFSPVAWQAHFITLIIPLGVAISFMLGTPRRIERKILYFGLGIYLILVCMVGTDLTKFIPHMNKYNLMNIAAGTIALAFSIICGYRRSHME